MANMICNTKIPGIPNLKYHFLVLWWKTVIPIMAPIEPPISAKPISFFSLMRHCLVIALHLSRPYKANVIIFIIIRYKCIYADCICKSPLLLSQLLPHVSQPSYSILRLHLLLLSCSYMHILRKIMQTVFQTRLAVSPIR